MRVVYLFSLCLIAGITCSQLFDLESYRPYLSFFSDIAVSYILIEIGLELFIDKKLWKTHLEDYWVAAIAAGLPWIFCFFYLQIRADQTWAETLLISRFAAPSASDILDPILAAAGFGGTWLFRKVRVLAILADIDTMLFIVPLQLLLMGTRYRILFVMIFVIILSILLWRYLHRLRLPSGRIWLLFYAVILTTLFRWIDLKFHLEIELLFPAFVWGSLIYNPDLHKPKTPFHEHIYLTPEQKPLFILDRSIKIAFMFLLGLLFPKLQIETVHISSLIADVLLLTLLANLGKCFLVFCFQKEASLKERIGVAISMWVRGELAAGILLLAIEKGIGGYATTVAGLSLALNLLLTGAFVAIVIRLVKGKNEPA
jgi:hypothetical protein